jgi:GNAT superfamily N-acetyltransferase
MTNIEIRYGTEHLDWVAINDLFVRAPLGERPPEMFKTACENSGVVLSAYREGEIVGFGRALTDFAAYAAIFDVVVMPEYQGKGVGSLIVEGILSKIPNCWMVTLIAEPGKEAFYKKLGFSETKTGMAKFRNVASAQSRGFI